MEISLSVHHDLRRLTRDLDDFAERQVPFAASQAINSLAADVQRAEKAHIKEVFPTATPFTIGSVGLRRSRKTDLEAIVFLRDIAAEYLGPYIDGGRHHLNSRALLNPKNINLNMYGNLPKGRLQALKGRKDVFIGGVTFKGSGETVNGVWQRVTTTVAGKGYAVRRGKGGRQVVERAKATQTTKLKLLIRFGDALPVEQHLDWGDQAYEIVEKGFNRAFAIAFARALSTAKE